MAALAPPCSCPLGPFQVANSPLSITAPIFSSSFTRNNCPLDPELETRIRSALSQADDETSRIDNALAQLTAVQDTLLLQRTVIQDFSATYAPLVSIIRRVPREILSEIFLYFRPDETSLDTPDLRPRVMLTSHVCQSWRNVALSTPQLWSTIIVNLGPRDAQRKLDCVKAWIERTGQYPLSIIISCIMPNRSARDWKALLDILMPHSHRWRSAKILTWTDYLSGINGHIPKLESLDIRIGGHSQKDTFVLSPSLRQLRVRAELNPGPVIRLSQLQLPWAQLTHCEPGICGVSDSLKLMQSMANLISFTVTLDDNGQPEWPSVNGCELRMEYLSHLWLSATRRIGELFELLVLPALTEFHFRTQHPEEPWANDEFISLIIRSSAPLKSLVIRIRVDMETMTEDITQLLQCTPELEHLELLAEDAKGSHHTQCIQSLLTYSPNDPEPCLVPRLQSVVVFVEDDADAGWKSNAMDGFIQMVESRWKVDGDLGSGGPIKGITLLELRQVPFLLADKCGKRAQDRLRGLLGQGLVVRTVDRDGRDNTDEFLDRIFSLDASSIARGVVQPLSPEIFL
ncbi:hypothetical protein FIBSPDRAFT_929586 [Athelia psychrophila]|uniref:Uncharacterized protein n=1 Tax=Athelia psychrophila TaxID=1759441 RepID=A0A166NIH5_9AGAM|nr:hypothetical protein FIBSPDRAFT_929586 [Fibularhizoctonia sp. CBS 109695]